MGYPDQFPFFGSVLSGLLKV